MFSSGNIRAMENDTKNNLENNQNPADPPADPPGDPKAGKRKALEAFGCLLYVIAFLIMGGVLLTKLGKL